MKENKLSRIIVVLLVVLFTLTTIFHICILAGILPYHMVWGGRLTNKTEMYQMESVSLLLNILFLVFAFFNSPFTQKRTPILLTRIGFTILGLLFLLNTLGNIVSKDRLEQLLFTPLTMITAILCFILAFRKKED